MSLFRKLSSAATIATFVLVAIGGLVRATKSGLGCGDNWPHCPGELNRAMLIESSHRAAAGAVIILIGLMLIVAWRSADVPGRFTKYSGIAFGLVLSQALIGAMVVWLHLDAESVVLHLATAMTLLALLIYITTAAHREQGLWNDIPRDADATRWATISAASVLVLLLVGSYVSGREAGYVFSDWPLMNGSLVPDLGKELYAIHFLHRLLAGVVGIIVFVMGVRIIRRRDELPQQAKLAHAALGLFGIEVAIGALNVWTQLNAAAVTAHLAVGSLIWGSFVWIVVLSRPATEPIEAKASAKPRRRLEPEGADA